MSSRAALGAVLAVLAVGIVAATLAFRNNDEEEPRVPERDPDALDVALVGDSFADQSQEAFKARMAELDLTTAISVFGGSALCDWIELGRMAELVEERPEMLVLSFAGNDVTGCINPTCDPDIGLSSCQDRPADLVAGEYRKSLDEVFVMFRDTGTEIYAVLPPPILDQRYEVRAAAMRFMYEAYVADHPELHLIDSATELDPDGTGYHATLPCDHGDEAECDAEGQVAVREGDGIHLTPAGGRRYAESIVSAIETP